MNGQLKHYSAGQIPYWYYIVTFLSLFIVPLLPFIPFALRGGNEAIILFYPFMAIFTFWPAVLITLGMALFFRGWIEQNLEGNKRMRLGMALFGIVFLTTQNIWFWLVLFPFGWIFMGLLFLACLAIGSFYAWLLRVWLKKHGVS